MTAELVWGEMPGMMVFDCSLADRDSAEVLADARLKCWVPEAGVGLEEFG